MGLRETWRNLLGGPGIKKKLKYMSSPLDIMRRTKGVEELPHNYLCERSIIGVYSMRQGRTTCERPIEGQCSGLKHAWVGGQGSTCPGIPWMAAKTPRV